MNTLYLLIQLANLVVFVVFIYDKPNKPGVLPLIDPRAITLLKILYPLPILTFAYSLFLPAVITHLDWIAMGLAIIGTGLVVKGKIDLGESHTWAGYYLPHAPVVEDGIFRWLAHPMYCGIIIVILSCSTVYVTRLPWFVSMIALLCCIYIIAFLILAARREEGLLLQVQ
ncbi:MULTISPECIES: methyltransferase [unclassified Enterobacter]|uniref:methyltransferase n=1 Tax=unclassified Enterobacter TaxID=2608935 RepID=UPI0008F2AB89|nr:MULTISPECIES: methyltransferase [unclassified Enterobacter]SFQ97763.1 Phospholipid methyltransferase [Enterobacter sp. kpr-6]